MFYLIYNLLSIVLLLPVIVYHLYRSVSRGRPPAFAERFGFISEKERAALRNRPVLWLHAVSVGESIAARPLLKALREHYPDHAVVVSNTTETGRGIAAAFPEKLEFGRAILGHVQDGRIGDRNPGDFLFGTDQQGTSWINPEIQLGLDDIVNQI